MQVYGNTYPTVQRDSVHWLPYCAGCTRYVAIGLRKLSRCENLVVYFENYGRSRDLEASGRNNLDAVMNTNDIPVKEGGRFIRYAKAGKGYSMAYETRCEASGCRESGSLAITKITRGITVRCVWSAKLMDRLDRLITASCSIALYRKDIKSRRPMALDNSECVSTV
jgi:hypothetical protein